MTDRMTTLLVAALVAVAVAGCGGEEREDNAVEATEANTVELDGVRYRVPLFRELNPHITADDAVYDGPPPADDHGLYAAFLQACNPNGPAAVPTEQVVLEDAYGQRFEPLPDRTDDDFGYRAAPLDAGECLPAEGSAADRTFDGVVAIFEVPFDAVAERPLILELVAEDERRRIQLDL